MFINKLGINYPGWEPCQHDDSSWCNEKCKPLTKKLKKTKAISDVRERVKNRDKELYPSIWTPAKIKEPTMDGQTLKTGEKKDSDNLQFFEEIVTRRIDLIRSVLVKKGLEYTRGTDRFRNFKTSGRRLGITPERALIGMRDKHETSIMDLVDDLDKDVLPTLEIIEEKIGDDINYLILLEGMFKERIVNGKPKNSN